MSARSDLAGLIAAQAPDTWQIYPYPATLRTFDDPAKTVAIVVEQRTVTAGTFSPTDLLTPVQVELVVWVVVDGSRGEDPGNLEDRLEEAVERMIRILEPLPEHAWTGGAARDDYDPQKPCYGFTLRFGGNLTT